MKHGLLSSQVLLPHEKARDLAALGERLRADLKPVGELETVLVDRMMGFLWRLRRFARIETGILEYQHRQVRFTRSLDDVMNSREQPELRATALKQRTRTYAARRKDLPTWGEAFMRDVEYKGALSKLSRYETTMERGFYKALHELQRLQAARTGKARASTRSCRR
jgi:hypothetical protein